MNETLNPDALKTFRKQRNWSQNALAEKSSCSIAQISRWERGKSLDIHKSSRERLTDALNVPWEQLTKPPQDSPNVNFLSRAVKLTASVKPSTRTALEMVQLMYGVNRSTIIELAPLLFLITAESSLVDRKRNIDGINEMIEEAREKGKKLVPHIADYMEYLGMGADEGIGSEEYSIKNREVFGPFDTYEGFDSDPYINYLNKLVEQLPGGLIDDIEPSMVKGSPDYRLSKSFLRQITGINGKTEKEEQLLTYIVDGDINLRELVSQKENLPESKFFAWLSGKLDQAKAEANERESRQIELMIDKGFSAVKKELLKEAMQNADVKMEDIT